MIEQPTTADLIKHPLPMVEHLRGSVLRLFDAEGECWAATCTYQHDRRGALRELHKVIASFHGEGARVHIFVSKDVLPGPRGPMAEDCRGFVGLKWRLA